MAVAAPALYLPDQVEFDDINLMAIGRKFEKDIPATIEFCRQNGLLAQSFICPKCEVHSQERQYSRCIDGIVWRCPVCRSTKNIRVGSFFEKSHLHLWQILGLTYIWTQGCGPSKGMSFSQTMKEVRVFSQHTILDWHQCCRNVCIEYCLRHPHQIGGDGHSVKIYTERLSDDMKCNNSPDQWMFGGYEPAKKDGFLLITTELTVETLVPLIQQWILAGSTIYSDDSEAYKSLSVLGYNHKIINQTEISDNAEKGKSMNDVQVKKVSKKKSIRSLKSECSVDELSESIWYQQFKNHSYHAFWFQIASELYPMS